MVNSGLVLFSAFSLFSCCFSAVVNGRQASTIPLPALPGPNAVGTIALELIDKSRPDPYVPPQPRKLMVSLYYPTTDTKLPFASYLPAEVAAIADQSFGFPPGFLESIQTQAHLNAPLKDTEDLPIILFSPGLGAVREEYTIALEGLASWGYLVVAMDHTYDGALVEFLDGSIAPALGINGDAQSVGVRTKDTSFVIDQLSNSSFIGQIPGIGHRNLKSSKIAMFGHSLGGTTTLSMLENDKRVVGGASLDSPFGPIFGSLDTTVNKKPFFYFGRENHTHLTDPDFAIAWKNLKGWKADITLAKSTHLTFLDVGAIFTEIGLLSLLDPTLVAYGTINLVRAMVVELVYLKAFFDFVLLEKEDTLFKKVDPAFPEIIIAGYSNGD